MQFLSIEINSFSISIWPVQNCLTVVNGIVSDRNGLYNFFSNANSIPRARNGLYKRFQYYKMPQDYDNTKMENKLK